MLGRHSSNEYATTMIPKKGSNMETEVVGINILYASKPSMSFQNSLSSVVEQVSTKGGYDILGLLDFFGVNSDY